MVHSGYKDYGNIENMQTEVQKHIVKTHLNEKHMTKKKKKITLVIEAFIAGQNTNINTLFRNKG